MSSEWPPDYDPEAILARLNASTRAAHRHQEAQVEQQSERDEVARQQLGEAVRARRYAFVALVVAVLGMLVAIAAIIVSVLLVQ